MTFISVSSEFQQSRTVTFSCALSCTSHWISRSLRRGIGLSAFGYAAVLLMLIVLFRWIGEKNLTLAFRRTLGRGGVAGGLARAYDMFPVLEQRRRQQAGTLSGGEQRMLSMARVLVEEPKVLVADELSQLKVMGSVLPSILLVVATFIL